RAERIRAEEEAAVQEAAAAAAAAAVERARAALAVAEDRLARTRVRAPFAGEVAAPAVEVGDWLAPGRPVCTLLDRGGLEVRAPLPIEEADRAAAGAPARIRFPALAGADGEALTLAGRLTGLEPAADPASRSRTAVIEVRDPEGRVPAGAFAEVELDLGRLAAIWLRPQEYRADEGGPVAFVVVAGRAERRPLRLGRARIDAAGLAWHPVLAGLEPGQSLVTDNLERVEDGAPLLLLED
ncbi:MAG: efflux RND transporter periplasmic adaptor subunit, partial [Planctomycetota bacterium]